MAVAAVIGGLWYLRNLVRHGSPLWPFVTTPWGDELRPIFDRIDGRLIFDPESARGRLGGYLRNLGVQWRCSPVDSSRRW